MSHVRVSAREALGPLIPVGMADLILGLEPVETLRILSPYGNSDVTVLMNTRPIYPIDVIAGNDFYPEFEVIEQKILMLSQKFWKLNATGIAMALGDPILSNIVMLGALTRLEIVPIDEETFYNVASENLPEKKMDANIEAFKRGTASL